MKSKILYNLFLTLVLVMPLSVIAGGTSLKGKHTKEKTIKKEFTVNSDALLRIKNSYGNINVATYEGNTTSIEVVIKTNGNDLDEVQKKLDEITVEFNATSNEVEAKTIFNKNKSKSWWNWGKGNNINMEINYIVNLPITNNVDLNNDYGSITLDKLEGSAIIRCDYGKITTKELMSDNNILSFDYTKNCYFEYIKSGKINADYSGYTVAKTKNLEISADYTDSTIEVAENVSYNCDYGSITINNANNVNGKGDYLTQRLGNIYKNVKLNADYGSIKIAKMAANAGSVLIESDYVGITIGYDPGYNFNFEIDLEYASLKIDDAVEISKKRIESTDKYYLGHKGNPNSGNNIKITSDYGSVTLKEN
ncbi:hypothetical protein [Meridianimaribacter flavus]|uniref:DUF4097 domain-containing protein n=1 Tax=Meridianimaribacter flavus TaxID=571115 RepID=A0ABY2G354_9FLAO|nr:hypothetical protein [Meridianimaribacter flavus]TDY11223.1 hypothetical protein A8975_1859 [Meridianimaribacter flavus]